MRLDARVLAAGVLAASAFAACAFDLQGHRGARGLAPENTLPAFAAALAVGVDTLELDTLVTRDGEVVIHHDRSLNPATTRGADGRWLAARGPLVRSLSYAELSHYDVGRLDPASAYAKNYPLQKPADGTRIPRLAELFAMARDTEVRFNIETKSSPLEPLATPEPEVFARALLEQVRIAGMSRRTTIQSFDWRTLQAVQKIAPGIPTVYLSARQKWLDNVAEGSPWTAGYRLIDHGSVPRMVKAAGGAVWSPYFGDLDAADLAEARTLGLKVIVWTVNEPAQIRRMLEMGVDGIISDRPDLVRAAMAERGMALPAAVLR